MNKIYLGKNFNELYKNKIFFKILSHNLTHHNFTYKLGLNEDTLYFNPSGECEDGGLYFADKEHIIQYLQYGSKYARVIIPDDAQVYIEKFKYKANKIILEDIKDITFENFENDGIKINYKQAKNKNILYKSQEGIQYFINEFIDDISAESCAIYVYRLDDKYFTEELCVNIVKKNKFMIYFIPIGNIVLVTDSSRKILGEYEKLYGKLEKFSLDEDLNMYANTYFSYYILDAFYNYRNELKQNHLEKIKYIKQELLTEDTCYKLLEKSKYIIDYLPAQIITENIVNKYEELYGQILPIQIKFQREYKHKTEDIECKDEYNRSVVYKQTYKSFEEYSPNIKHNLLHVKSYAEKVINLFIESKDIKLTTLFWSIPAIYFTKDICTQILQISWESLKYLPYTNMSKEVLDKEFFDTFQKLYGSFDEISFDADYLYDKYYFHIHNMLLKSDDYCKVVLMWLLKKNKKYAWNAQRYIEGLKEYLTEDSCIELIKTNQKYINYIPNELITKKIFDEYFKLHNICPANKIQEKLNSKDVCNEYFNSNMNIFPYIPDGFKNLEMCEKAVIYNYEYLLYVPDRLKTENLCAIAVSNSKHKNNLSQVPQEIRTKKFYEECIKINPYMVDILPGNMKNENMYKFVVKQYLKWINNNSSNCSSEESNRYEKCLKIFNHIPKKYSTDNLKKFCHEICC